MARDHRTFTQPRLPRIRNDGSRVWSTSDVVAQIEAHADFAESMLGAAREVIRRACADRDDRVKSPALEGGRGGGDEDGRVPQMVLASELLASAPEGTPPEDRKHVGWREDPVRVAMRGLAASLVAIHLEQQRLSAALASLQALDGEQARRLVEDRKPQRGKCCDNPHCGRWVAGGTADPIRSGRCTPCAAYWRRKGVDRPKELVEEQVYREAG